MSTTKTQKPIPAQKPILAKCSSNSDPLTNSDSGISTSTVNQEGFITNNSNALSPPSNTNTNNSAFTARQQHKSAPVTVIDPSTGSSVQVPFVSLSSPNSVPGNSSGNAPIRPSLDLTMPKSPLKMNNDRGFNSSSPALDSIGKLNLNSSNNNHGTLAAGEPINISSNSQAAASSSKNLLLPNADGKFLVGKTPNQHKRYGRVRSWNSESMTTTTKSSSMTNPNITNELDQNSSTSFHPEFDKSPTTTLKFRNQNKKSSRGRKKSQKTLDEKARTDAELPVMTISNSRTIYTHGRPPWYSADGEFKDAFLIGICGGSASGKTTVAKKIIEKLNMNWVVLLSMDCFYKDLNQEELDLAAQNEWNFDAPHSFDLDMCVENLKKLKQGRAIDCPQYDFTTHQRDPVSKPIYGANVIIFEGILSMCDERLRDLMDLKIFVDTDSDIRLARRLRRDMASRARNLRSVIAQYEKFVKPSYETYIHPLIKYADIVIPRGGENLVAINLITQQIQKELQKVSRKFVGVFLGPFFTNFLSKNCFFSETKFSDSST